MVFVKGNVAEFSSFHPMAQQVYLIGDFNGWRPGEPAMKRDADGFWRITVRLPTGRFRFRYCADGEWYADCPSVHVEPDGQESSVVRVCA